VYARLKFVPQIETVATTPGDFRVLVPTLCVGMPAGPLCGPHREGGQAEGPRGQEDDAERRRRHSHAERGNERRRCGPLPVSLLQSPFS
jgi:hypothetical protein